MLHKSDLPPTPLQRRGKVLCRLCPKCTTSICKSDSSYKLVTVTRSVFRKILQFRNWTKVLITDPLNVRRLKPTAMKINFFSLPLDLSNGIKYLFIGL